MGSVLKSQPRTPNQSGDITTYSWGFFSKKNPQFVNRLILPFINKVLVHSPSGLGGEAIASPPKLVFELASSILIQES